MGAQGRGRTPCEESARGAQKVKHQCSCMARLGRCGARNLSDRSGLLTVIRFCGYGLTPCPCLDVKCERNQQPVSELLEQWLGPRNSKINVCVVHRGTYLRSRASQPQPSRSTRARNGVSARSEPENHFRLGECVTALGPSRSAWPTVLRSTHTSELFYLTAGSCDPARQEPKDNKTIRQ